METIIDREFDALSITVEFFDRQIFLQVNFCEQTSTGTSSTQVYRYPSTGTGTIGVNSTVRVYTAVLDREFNFLLLT
jgi:hypothetical protein